MHKDEVKGVGKQAKGAIKDAVGGLTGNEKLQAEGKADKIVGKVSRRSAKPRTAPATRSSNSRNAENSEAA